MDNYCIKQNKKDVELEAIDKLIQAVTYFGEVFFWNDSDVIDTLVANFGITEEEFVECGYGDYVGDYFESE